MWEEKENILRTEDFEKRMSTKKKNSKKKIVAKFFFAFFISDKVLVKVTSCQDVRFQVELVFLFWFFFGCAQ